MSWSVCHKVSWSVIKWLLFALQCLYNQEQKGIVSALEVVDGLILSCMGQKVRERRNQIIISKALKTTVELPWMEFEPSILSPEPHVYACTCRCTKATQSQYYKIIVHFTYS